MAFTLLVPMICLSVTEKGVDVHVEWKYIVVPDVISENVLRRSAEQCSEIVNRT